MTRTELDDKISYCKRELKYLEQIKPNCFTCEKRSQVSNICAIHGPIPDEFLKEGCDSWVFDDVPF